MPALEAVSRAARGRRRRRALDGASLVRRRRRSSSGSRPTRRSPSAPPASTLDDPDAIVDAGAGFVGALPDRRRARAPRRAARRVAAAGRADRRSRQGKIAGVPAKLVIRRTASRCSSSRRPMPTSWPTAGMAAEVSATAVTAASASTSNRSSRSLARAARRRTTSSSSAAAATASRPRTTSRRATGSRTSPSSRPTTSRSGNTGRNTTIIRANYAIPEAIRFYDHSLKLYEGLEAETGAAIFHRRKGHVWLAHTEMGLRTERGRVPDEPGDGRRDRAARRRPRSRSSIPQIDLTGGGRYPVLGASHHVAAATARHDRVAWAYASGATARGVHVIQHRPVTGLLATASAGRRGRDGRRAASGPASSCRRVGGRVTQLAAMAGVRLPIRTHPLHAFVTNDFAQGLDKIVASTELACYVVADRARPDAHRGRVRQPALVLADLVVRRAPELRLQDHGLLPFLRAMRILRTWAGLCDISADFSPIMGETGVDGFLITTGWGTWGFKAIPAGGEALAERIATGRTPDLIAPFGLDRFRRDARLADQALGGDALMHDARLPALRPAAARRVHVRRRAAADRRLADRPRGSRLRRGLGVREPRRASRPSAGSTRPAAGAG